METPFLDRLGQKILIFRGFGNFFFLKTTGFLLKFLIWTEFPNIPNWKPAKKTTTKNLIRCALGAKFGPNYVQCYEEGKETGNIIRFFSYFTWGLPFKESAKLCGLHGLMGWMGGMGAWVTWVQNLCGSRGLPGSIKFWWGSKKWHGWHGPMKLFYRKAY